MNAAALEMQARGAAARRCPPIDQCICRPQLAAFSLHMAGGLRLSKAQQWTLHALLLHEPSGFGLLSACNVPWSPTSSEASREEEPALG